MNDAPQTNLEILKERHPLAAQAVAESTGGPAVEVFPSRAGAPTARVLLPSGETHMLHSAYDPGLEARRFVEAALISRGDAVVIFGFGLGHHVRAALDAAGGDGFVAVIEQHPSVLRAAMNGAQLADILLSENFTVFAGGDIVAFTEWLKEIATDLVMRNLRICAHEPSVQISPDGYESARIQVENIIESARVEFVTLRDSGRLFFENVWRNLPAIAEGGALKDLAGRFAGLPSINIAAGPSLDKSIPALKEAGNRAVIIAVDTALKPLLESGVVPHVVVAVDPTERSARYLECMEGREMKETVLVCGMSVSPLLVERFRGRKYFIEENLQICRFLRPYIGEKGAMGTGLSVAHTAFFLAREMGCDPIALVAQDLSFSDGRTHASGIVQTWGGAVDENDPALLWLEGNDSGKVPSRAIFRSFLATFEREIAVTRARVVNATDGGALIRGCERRNLRELLNSLATDVRGAFASLPAANSAADLSALAKHCKILKAAAEDLAAEAREAADFLEAARAAIDPAKHADEANTYLQKVCKHGWVLDVLQDLMLESRLAVRYKRGENAREQMETSRMYARSAADAAALLARCAGDFIKGQAK
jgi:hypothetical protein